MKSSLLLVSFCALVAFCETREMNFNWTKLSPKHNFGAIVDYSFDLDFPKDDKSALQTGLLSLLDDHKLLLFRKQKLEDNLQIEISKIFGRLHSTFYKHPRSPHPDIFRVSNDESEGCTNVGRSGWHVDGTFLSHPFSVQLMHFPSVSKSGLTQFINLESLFEKQNEKTRDFWSGLRFISDSSSHPLVYRHPRTEKNTMIFHLGDPFCRGFLLPSGKLLRKSEVGIQEAIDKGEILSIVWESGDFAIIDNLAVAHYAHPNTQLRREKDGLRILHRTTVEGFQRPKPQISKSEM